MDTYVGPRYEYATVMEIIGTSVQENNLQDPPYVSAFGVTITPTTSIVDALNEIGAQGWQLHSTTAVPFADGIQALIFMVLSRPLQN